MGDCAKSGQGGEGVRVRGSISFFKKNFFLMCTILKVFLEFVTMLLQFYVLLSWPQAPWPGGNPHPLEGEVFSAGQPGKSLFFLIYPREWTQSAGPGKACVKYDIGWILGPPGPLFVEHCRCRW